MSDTPAPKSFRLRRKGALSLVAGTALAAVSIFTGVGTASSTTTGAVRKVSPTKKPVTPKKPVTSQTTVAVAGAKKNCTVKIMPLGDSLTAFPDSYRGALFRQLQALGYKIDFVGSAYWEPTGGGDPNGEGHGGYTIGPDERIDSEGKPGNIAQNVDSWVNSAKPDVILLTIGTNDLSANSIKAAAAPGKLRALVEHIATTYPATKLIVGDIPLNIYNVKAPADTIAVNEVARSLGNASGTDNIVYGDTSSNLTRLGFEPVSGLSDGTHFTAAAGELFAKAWLPSLQPILDARAC